MNWELHAVHTKNLPEMINEYCYLAERAIEDWIEKFEPEKEVQPESDFAEFPKGFYRNEKTDPFAYSYTFTAGFYADGKYYRFGQVPYDITVSRATPADYAGELGITNPQTIRFRYIDTQGAIA